MIQPISFQTPAVSMPAYPAANHIASGKNSEKVLTADTKDVKKVSDTSIDEKKDEPKESSKSLKDVVAVSKDGDTVQVSDKGQERYKNEIAEREKSAEKSKEIAEEILAQNQKHEEKVKELTEKMTEKTSDEDSKQAVTSLAGYTNSQLKQLYLKGDISQYAYESRVEQKEEALSNDLEANKKDSEENAKNIEKVDTADRKMSAIESAFSSDSSDTLSSEQRMDVLNKLDGTSEQEKNSQLFSRWQRDFQFLLA